ncbi:hypothetical protein MTZ49_12960 [Entomomonas sp. E2T0]|uniref:hypothetical protein n=1 Tax=Entomomonas sp. E2T0 TaxID=2930213 RepID=UPI0022285062|nr:hypothetical protein [Entomomonas sp. E2T0]UYZ83494.1 hypothetical protein MTZ49_12960 [Entomomonas sp. E2T0]
MRINELYQNGFRHYAYHLEVQRDDGSWKEIGDFQLEADKEKTITAQIETIVLPFKLELVKGL